ncbi:MAG: NAD(P)-dependent oxidoreductase [Desulfovibrio sp.]|jgi:GDP-4-dehydro-6-deoxy-D-mannose reductase|nr:NAD(P)-dependent oxidoreductase [Desulfovibrio sp.]
MKVLVSGASGFLGNVLRRQLEAGGHDVWTFGAPGWAVVPESRHFHIEDISSPEAHAQMLRQTRPDWIFHLAGVSRAAGIREAYMVNSVWGGTLLLAAGEACPDSRVMLIGSAAEYGPQQTNEHSKFGYALDEQTECRPVGLYGISKLAQTLHALSLAGKQDIVVARPFNIVGPGMPESLALGGFVKRIKELPAGGGVLPTGPLGGIRDFIDVRDCAATLIALMQTAASAGKVINVCSEEATLMRDLLALVIDRAGCPVSVQEAPSSSKESDVYVGAATMLRALGIRLPGADLPAIVDAMMNGRMGG